VQEKASDKVLYVGIDVAKSWLDLAANVDGKRTVSRKRVDNDNAGFRAAVKWAKTHQRRQGAKDIHFCLESTGVYSEAITEYLQEVDKVVSMINPSLIKSFATSRLLRTRTDKMDAELIAIYCQAMKPAPTQRIPEEMKELKSLVRHLEHLKDQRIEEKTYLEAATDKEVTSSTRKNIAHYEAEIKRIEKKIKKHLDEHPHLKKKIDLLTSIPGIGDTSAQVILCELHRQGLVEHISRRAQTAHAGLAPMEKTSGSSVRKKPRLCKTGNGRLRKSLYFPTVTAIQRNPVVKEFYERLISRGKHRMVALVAAMRKLLVIAIGVLNNESAFDPIWERNKRLRLVEVA